MTSCPETLFGSSYFAMRGFGPYSNKNNADFAKFADTGKNAGKK